MAAVAGSAAVTGQSPLRRLASSTALYALTAAAQQAAGFLLIPFYTRLIPTAAYGVLEMLNASLSIAMMCVTLGLASAINKVHHRDCAGPEEQQAVVGTAMLASFPLLAMLAAVVMTFAEPLSAMVTGNRTDGGLLRLATASSVCGAMVAMVLAGLRARERIVAYSAVSVVQFALALVVNLLLVAVAGLGVRGVLLGNLTANGAALALAVVLTGRVRFDRRLARPLLAFGLAILPAMLSNWVMEVSDRYLLRVFRDLGEVAQYGVGYKFGMAIQLLVTWPFQLAWPAIAFGISNDAGHERTYARVFTYLLLTLTAIVLVFVAASTSILPHVIGREYLAACGVVPVVAGAYALSALQYCVAPGIHVGGRTRSLSAIGVGAAVSNLALGLLLIPAFGMMGAAWATVGSYALALGGALWLAQRTHPVVYEGARIVRVLVAGVVAGGLLEFLAARTAGAWLAAGQLGVLLAFGIVVLLSGFVEREERAYVAGFVQRWTPVASGERGA